MWTEEPFPHEFYDPLFPRFLLLTPQRRGRAEASEQQAEAGADRKLQRWVFSLTPDVSSPAVDSLLVQL